MDTEVRTPRPQKVAVVDEVRERLGHSEATILTEYRGLSVAQLQLLRRALAPAGGEYKVYKNTLVRRAAKEGGLEELEALLTGPTALAFVTGGDVSAVAKALKEFARQHPSLVVKGAVIGGGLFDAAQTSAIADLPSRDALLAQIAGALAAPMQRLAGLFAAVPQKLAYALSALIEARGGTPTSSAAPEESAGEVTEASTENGAPEDASPEEPPDAEPVAPAEENAPDAVEAEAAAEGSGEATSEPAGDHEAEGAGGGAIDGGDASA